MPKKKIDYASMYSYDEKRGLYYTTRTIRGVRRKFRSKDPEELHEKVTAAESAPPPVPTFREIADAWQEKKWQEVGLNTQQCYKAAYDRAVAHFGDTPVTEITPADVSRLIQKLASQGYSSKTVKTQKGVVRMIFSSAILCDPPIIKINPADYITIPRGLPKSKRSAPDDDTMQAIIDNVHTAYFGLFAYLLLYTGCRRGEALALTWGDIDFDAKTIRVNKEYIYPAGMPVLKLPKTEAGIRTVPLLPGLEAALNKPEDAKPSALLFPAPDGRPLQENAFRRRWRHYCKDAGLVSDIIENRTRKNGTTYQVHVYTPTITPHQLRHGYATVLYEAEIDEKTAQSLLGHADIHTTMQIYTDIRDKRRAVQTEKLASYLGRLDGTRPAKKDPEGDTQRDTKTATA